MLRGRSGAEAKLHAVAHMFERTGRRLALQSVHIQVQSRPPLAQYFQRRISSVVLQGRTAQYVGPAAIDNPCIGANATQTLTSRRLIHRRHDGGKPVLKLRAHFRVREHIGSSSRIAARNARRDIRWVKPGLQAFGNLGEQQARRACGIRRLRRAVALGPIAAALADPGANKAGTEHGHGRCPTA